MYFNKIVGKTTQIAILLQYFHIWSKSSYEKYTKEINAHMKNIQCLHVYPYLLTSVQLSYSKAQKESNFIKIQLLYFPQGGVFAVKIAESV